MTALRSFLLRGLLKVTRIALVLGHKVLGLIYRIERGLHLRFLGVSSTPTGTATPSGLLLYEAIPEIKPIHPALPRTPRAAKVTLLLPSLQDASFFGGALTAVLVAGFAAARLGRDLRVVETVQHGEHDPDRIRAALAGQYPGWTGDLQVIDMSGRRYDHYGYLDIHPDDVHVASAWWDAHILQQLELPRRFVYLVQDYEPGFYGSGSKQVLAERTYRAGGFSALCNTELLHEFMSQRGYLEVARGLWFEPAIAHTAPLPANSDTSLRRLFLYARPSVDRNLFPLAMQAIDTGVEEGWIDPEEWEILLAGESSLPDIALTGGTVARSLGKLTLEEYADLVASVDVAISPMLAPHPNYPTLECASSGAVVVTTAFANKRDLSRYGDRILVCDPHIDALTRSVHEAVATAGREDRRGPIPTILPATWSEALEIPMQKILDEVLS